MHSHDELEVRNAIWDILQERRFAPDLYPDLKMAGYMLFKEEEVYEIINDIMDIFIMNNIDPGKFGKRI